MQGIIKKLVVFAFVVVIIVMIASKNDSAAAEASKSLTSSSTASAPSLATPPQLPTLGKEWTYMHDEDEMSNTAMYAAFVESTNTLEFSPPYAGTQRASLGLRTHSRHGKRVVLFVDRGQFICNSYQDCTVLVRFDDQKPQNYLARGSADYSTTAIYMRNYSGFVENMLKAKRVRIAAKVYQEGQPVFDFDVSGFDASKYKPKN